MSDEQDASAFPLHMHGDYGKGMTLRDYFAAAALQGFVTNNGTDTAEEALAAWSYSLADAMLATRKEGA
jgi:hypothetical protein